MRGGVRATYMKGGRSALRPRLDVFTMGKEGIKILKKERQKQRGNPVDWSSQLEVAGA